MIRKKQRLYNKANQSHKGEDWDENQKHKKEKLKCMRKAKWNYINQMLLEGMTK